ncbi:glycosyltransferase [Roseicyclus sp.]|uniref:glycosyltransferase n=1 Tax=Roseicyclus sp. TaxID=1914329 RepID=UPI003FA07B6F
MTVRRIFHVQMGRDGGTERFFVTLAQAFAERGIEQAFAIRPGNAWAPEIARLGAVHEGHYLRRTPGALWSLARLRRAMRAWGPDAAMAWRAPAARLIPDLAGVVKIVRLGDYPRHVRHFAHLQAVVCNNPTIARHVEALGWRGAAPVISNFARPVTPRPVTRDEMATPPDAFVISSAGRLTHIKGYDTLLRAVAALPGCWLWLAGDGDLRGALEAQARDLGIADRVRFVGWLAEPMDLIAGSDAFVMPSREEPLGNVVIEAWHCGVPTVATRTDGPTWFATDGKDCLLVPIDDAPAMAAAMARLRDDADLRAALVAEARRTLAARFSKEAVVDAYLDLFDRLGEAST